MDRESINQQLRIEQGLLQHIVDALVTTLDWDVLQEGMSRKLSTLRFLVQALQRHMHRLWAIHEFDGYMFYVLSKLPELKPQIDALKEEHEQIRHRVEDVASRLERAMGATEDVDVELSAILQQFEACKARETQLIQEAFMQDTGGEG
jgi:chromosome segregation ATPase